MTIPSFRREDRGRGEAPVVKTPYIPFVQQEKLKRHSGVRSTIQHWQLRDLLACPDGKRLYHVMNSNVLMFSRESGSVRHALKDISFSPTSMTVAHGYLCVGGQRSQLLVRSLDNNWFAQTQVGGSINNALHVTETRGNSRLFISNNDESIKVYSLPDLRRVTSIVLPTPVNYVSVSPCGQHLLAVGDSPNAYLFRIQDGPNPSYHRIATLPVSTDANFSCDWSHSGEQFAVASQDGVVCVWDIRMVSMEQGVRSNDNNFGTERVTLTRGTLNEFGTVVQRESSSQEPMVLDVESEESEADPWAAPRRYSVVDSALSAARRARTRDEPRSESKKLAVFHTSQHPLPAGAARSVKFTRCGGSIDLMAFTEHTGCVNLVDARTFGERQTVRVSSASEFLGSEPHITGLCFTPDSRSIFVGLEAAVVELDINTLSRRTFAEASYI